jgi:hypothetical protein
MCTSFIPKEETITLDPIVHWNDGRLYYYVDSYYGGKPPRIKDEEPKGWEQIKPSIWASTNNELAASTLTNEYIKQDKIRSCLRASRLHYITCPAIDALNLMGYSVLVKRIIEETKTTTTTYQELRLPLEDRSHPFLSTAVSDKVDEKIERRDSHTALENK